MCILRVTALLQQPLVPRRTVLESMGWRRVADRCTPPMFGEIDQGGEERPGKVRINHSRLRVGTRRVVGSPMFGPHDGVRANVHPYRRMMGFLMRGPETSPRCTSSSGSTSSTPIHVRVRVRREPRLAPDRRRVSPSAEPAVSSVPTASPISARSRAARSSCRPCDQRAPRGSSPHEARVPRRPRCVLVVVADAAPMDDVTRCAARLRHARLDRAVSAFERRELDVRGHGRRRRLRSARRARTRSRSSRPTRSAVARRSR